MTQWIGRATALCVALACACGGTDGTETMGAGGGSGRTAAQCFTDIQDGPVQIDYDQYRPNIASTCSGTNHQDIQAVERLVYLGDSITAGDFISPKYVDTLTPLIQTKFVNISVQDCSVQGARNNDFLANDNQIANCFPSGVETAKTLVIITMGGNDIASYAKDHLPVDQALAQADGMLGEFREAITWLKSPAHFPNGSYVIFANVYEFTDTSGNLSSCPAAGIAGFSGTWAEGVAVLPYINEGYMKIAVDTRSDMIFMAEAFCGHGFAKDDASLQCYRGPNTPQYFDLTCIHPNAEGANVIANLFMDVVNE
jgi:lysophospholipase L1-like esterase